MSTRVPQDIANAIVDPVVFGDPDRMHEAYGWLRRNMPLAVAEPEGFDPFWVVTRHADLLEVSRQNALFHNGDRPTTIVNREGDQFVRRLTGGSPHLVRSLVQMDAPDHPKYRALTQSWFMPQNLRKIEDRVRAIAKSAVDRFLSRGSGTCDFVADVALGFPLHVVMDILGVPSEDEPRMLRLTQELFGAQDPDQARMMAMMDPEQIVMMLKATVDDFQDYFSAISEDRRKTPREDLATVLANSRIDGQPIPDFDMMSYYIIVATAGHDTTSSSTAGAVWALARDPEQFDLVKKDPGLIPGLVDEAIRWTTPVKTFMRSATEDTELAGQKIAKDDWLMLCYASGNRDETVFEDPFRFRVDRKPNRHLAFGYGAHLCLGQHLAKMEMRLLFEELIPRLKSLELAGEPRTSQSTFVNGPKSLPIRYEIA
ncbi:cytochrome P450 [Zavarzinia compransoris]|uniref:Cytochrome P450 n=1 Tax=Zavarzinia compransoris TaxID=1264899 RepID=A0A317DTH3_9PROT|nr:cytochrome P450 [Zavarzinia compransoris]PWR17988.1 cytochrome P450 [Zavarzinia compransoris]TDP43550.1 hypothetical protein DES42_111118 [Zavarzinia compransoris]